MLKTFKNSKTILLGTFMRAKKIHKIAVKILREV